MTKANTKIDSFCSFHKKISGFVTVMLLKESRDTPCHEGCLVFIICVHGHL